jgi:hypothetical protein
LDAEERAREQPGAKVDQSRHTTYREEKRYEQAVNKVKTPELNSDLIAAILT